MSEVRRVAVVDDEDAVLQVLTKDLEADGFLVLPVRAPYDVAAMIAWSPHVIVLDFKLADSAKSGLEMLKEIRGRNKFVPVISFSANAGADDENNLALADVDFALPKGEHPSALNHVIRRLASARDPVVHAIEQWALLNPDAPGPTFSTSSRSITLREALDEIRRGTEVGLTVLNLYQTGVGAMFANRIKPAES